MPTILSPGAAATRVARAVRYNRPDAEVLDARRDLAVAGIAAAIEKHLSVAPPLNDDQVVELTRILRGGAR